MTKCAPEDEENPTADALAHSKAANANDGASNGSLQHATHDTEQMLVFAGQGV